MRRDEGMVLKGVEIIERNARLQARLIDDLLDMSRIVSGHVRMEPELIEPWRVVEAAVEAVRPAAFSKQIELTVSLDRRCGRVWADPGRLQQVMWNLLSNAIKFTELHGKVGVSLQAEGSEVVLRVADNGIGISPDFLPHMFERFRQADASSTRRHGGLGLGLAISRQLVELHGGTVDVASEGTGQGATFTVRLPMAAGTLSARERDTGALAAVAEPLAPHALEDLTGTHVLVVDDDPDARQLLEQILGDRGAQVRTAEGAADALSLLQKQAPDVLISDIGMPGMDGFELIRRVRSHSDRQLAGLRALALTAFTRTEDESRALREGFDAYLPKPVEAAMLVSRVAGLRA
jgi:CheY-like chemotaxis protein